VRAGSQVSTFIGYMICVTLVNPQTHTRTKLQKVSYLGYTKLEKYNNDNNIRLI